MNRSRLLAIAVLLVVALTLASDLSGGFRSEDFLAIDRDARVPFAAAITQTHLGSTMVAFWRPLADGLTWLIVRGIGVHPGAIHLLLAALHGVAAISVGVALRRLFGLGERAALAASMLALFHPFAPAVTSYLDGGLAMLLVAIATFQALAALASWREREGGAVALAAWTLVAMLSHDAAILLPIVLVLVAWLLPRRERGAPWWLLLAIPLLLGLRQLVIGRAFDGYGMLEGPDASGKLLAFPGRVALCTARLFFPAFPGDVHATASWVAVGVFAVWIGIAAFVTRRIAADGGRVLREAVASLVLVIGLLGMAAEFFVMPRGAPPDELVLAYKTYPAALAVALALGWLFGRAGQRTGWGSLRFAAIVALLWLALRIPLANAHDEALRWGRQLPAAIAAATEKAPSAPVLALDVALRTERQREGGALRPVTRAFQYGLPSALRPPFVAPERFVYPIFRVGDGMLEYFSQEAIDAFTASPWLTPLRCRYGAVAAVVAVERPTPRASLVRLVASVDTPAQVLLPDLSDAPRVAVTRFRWKDEAGVERSLDYVELGAAGEVAGELSLLIANRMHPFQATVLRRTKEANGIDRVYFGNVPWLREVATRFPDDVVFAVLQTRPPRKKDEPPPPALDVSNVLPIRLFIGPDRK